MHHIYRTEAIVLSSSPSGESGKYLTLFSKDYGVLKIEAAAVRNINSKLRQSIQNYSVSNISFVRGKTGNKLVNASFLYSLFYEINDFKILKTISNIFRLIEKMIIDEDQDKNVYELIIKVKETIKKDVEYSKIFLESLEITVVYKILCSLGYVDKEGQYQFIFSEEFNLELIKKVEELIITDKEKIIRLVNQAINESHL
jgi:DNA repair protein RecO (recombination protein O)